MHECLLRYRYFGIVVRSYDLAFVAVKIAVNKIRHQRIDAEHVFGLVIAGRQRDSTHAGRALCRLAIEQKKRSVSKVLLGLWRARQFADLYSRIAHENRSDRLICLGSGVFTSQVAIFGDQESHDQHVSAVCMFKISAAAAAVSAAAIGDGGGLMGLAVEHLKNQFVNNGDRFVL